MEETVDLLETAKTVQKNRIGHMFRFAPDAGCEVTTGYVMDATRESVDNLTKLRDRLVETTTATTTIRDFHNQFHTVTVADLTEITGELVDFGLGLYSRKWAREQAIEAATTVEAVESITW